MYVGIDIGASNTKVVIKKSCDIVKLPKFETPNCAIDFIKNIRDILSQYVCSYELHGISVAVPGQIDMNRNCILNVPNIEWLDNNIIAQLSNIFDCTIKIVNDAKAGAAYETVYGTLKSIKRGLYISCGTGLGGCAIIDGKPDYGYSGSAGEFGHMIIAINGKACSCGRKGCWEAYASAKAILQELRQITDRDISLFSFAQELNQENSLFEEVFKEFMTYFEAGLSNLIYIYNPSVICFAGGTVDILPILSYLKLAQKCKKSIYKNIELCQAIGDPYACAEGALYNVFEVEHLSI